MKGMYAMHIIIHYVSYTERCLSLSYGILVSPSINHEALIIKIKYGREKMGNLAGIDHINFLWLNSGEITPYWKRHGLRERSNVLWIIGWEVSWIIDTIITEFTWFLFNSGICLIALFIFKYQPVSWYRNTT